MKTVAQNQHNARLRTDNTSGVKGVSWHRGRSAWVVNIQVDGQQKYIGSRDTLEDAAALVTQVRNDMHKEYANHG